PEGVRCRNEPHPRDLGQHRLGLGWCPKSPGPPCVARSSHLPLNSSPAPKCGACPHVAPCDRVYASTVVPASLSTSCVNIERPWSPAATTHSERTTLGGSRRLW